MEKKTSLITTTEIGKKRMVNVEEYTLERMPPDYDYINRYGAERS